MTFNTAVGEMTLDKMSLDQMTCCDGIMFKLTVLLRDGSLKSKKALVHVDLLSKLRGFFLCY
jgi:hypothetical protein